MSAKDIVNMASAGWKILESGRPSSDIDGTTANAVPQVDDWNSLAGAQGPKQAWTEFKNYVGWPFDDYLNVHIQIVLKWEYGATYNHGGAYIPNIWVEVPECFLGFGYDADIDLHVRNPTNAGTDDAPIARIPVSVSGTVSCPLWSSRIEKSYVLFGNGHVE